MSDGSELLPVVPPSMSAAERARIGLLSRYSNRLTLQSYEIALRQWFGWCDENGVDPLRAERVHLELFTRALKASGRKDGTIAQKMIALSGFFKYAVIDGLIPRNPMEYVRRIYPPRQSRTNGLSRFEMKSCLDVAEKIGPRHHVLVCLIGLNGLRVSDALGVDIEHLGGDRYLRTITLSLGKTGDDLVIPLIPRTNKAVDELIGDRTEGPLFVTSTGGRVHRSYADKMAKRVARKAGIAKRISCHSFRHAFVTMALDNGVHLRDVMNSTGHRDPRSMLYYDRNRNNLERNATWSVGSWVAGVTD